MDVHHVLQNPVGMPLADRAARWPRLLAAMVGGDEVPVTPDLAVPLVDMRDTVTKLINDLVAGLEPSTADWRQLTDQCMAHLLWSTSRPGLRGAGHEVH